MRTTGKTPTSVMVRGSILSESPGFNCAVLACGAVDAVLDTVHVLCLYNNKEAPQSHSQLSWPQHSGLVSAVRTKHVGAYKTPSRGTVVWCRGESVGSIRLRNGHASAIFSASSLCATGEWLWANIIHAHLRQLVSLYRSLRPTITSTGNEACLERTTTCKLASHVLTVEQLLFTASFWRYQDADTDCHGLAPERYVTACPSMVELPIWVSACRPTHGDEA
nr:hypothetical protein CFP56_26023 [Quercus suber]